ncbi:MAG TPA: serine/threonine-protein kinase [Polyangia bacterium]|nr:serine/threonine-protein kinase [Polyangia bacterium]
MNQLQIENQEPTSSPPVATPIALPTPTPLFAKDEILDNTYRIVDGLAAGGMGEVYRAVHLRFPRALAIKTLQPEFAARPEWVTRFCREACVLAQLHHPNIVQVVDFNVAANGVPYIAMELIEGEDLRMALDAGRHFDAGEIVAIVRQVASALDAAHAAGVVHRDLKPENVVLTPAPGQAPVVKVIDFGASLCEWTERVTGDCAVFGTPDYMAPEQAQGLRDQVDGRTDQFALAALTYTLITGRAPFARATPVAVLYAIVHENPAELGVEADRDMAPVERVLRKGMSRDRENRYPTVLAFAEALEAALIDVGAIARRSQPVSLRLMPSTDRPTKRLRPTARRTLRRTMPAVVLSLSLLGALGWQLGSVRSTVSSQWTRLRGFGARVAAVVPSPPATRLETP